jgi:Uncharacterised nucleotidyltransferase
VSRGVANEQNIKNQMTVLERFLEGEYEFPPQVSFLHSLSLGAWAFSVLSKKHPSRSECRDAFIGLTSRHALIKLQVLEMVRAWNRSGIVPLLYKGFALSEFSYSNSGSRFYGDVDVLIHPNDFSDALKVGRESGWEVPDQYEPWLYPNPHELSLKQPDGLTTLDVHVRLVHSFLPWVGREERLTRSAWNASRVIDWEGAKIRLLTPEDSFLFGLVISRCWNGDGWRLKPHDLLDGFALIERSDLALEQVVSRANALGLSRTLKTFLGRCNPFGPRVDLRAVSKLEVFWFEMLSAREHLPPFLALLLLAPFRAGTGFFRLLQLVPVLIDILRCFWRTSDLDLILAYLESRNFSGTFPKNRLNFLYRFCRGLRQSSGIVWPLMVYLICRQPGQVVTFKVGRFRNVYRAWVEVGGMPLPEFTYEYGSLEGFKVLYQRLSVTRNFD